MSDALDSEAGEELAIEEARKIRLLDPNNELIRLVVYVGDNNQEWKKLRNEFTTRFGKEGFRCDGCRGENAVAYFWAEYWLALKAERERLEADKVTV